MKTDQLSVWIILDIVSGNEDSCSVFQMSFFRNQASPHLHRIGVAAADVSSGDISKSLQAKPKLCGLLPLGLRYFNILFSSQISKY